MTEEQLRIFELLSKHRTDLTTQEEEELQVWMQKSEENRELFRKLNDPDHLISQLKEYEGDQEEVFDQPVVFPKERIIKFSAWWWAAASILVLFVVVGYVFFLSKPLESESTENRPIAVVQPARQQATLTINGARSYSLDSIATGARIGGATKSDDGTLLYEKMDRTEGIVTHTLSTPEGGFYSMVLRDGSKVTMNAASSLSYPSRFEGAERKVFLNGQAYFEVAHDSKNTPFVIETKAGEVLVTGTHFDIKSYDNEVFATTLFEGGVTIKAKGQEIVKKLKPGEQARIKTNSKDISITVVDTKVVEAWRKGNFAFDQTPFDDVLREISRWYAAPIVMKDGASSSELFNGDFDNKMPLRELLEHLQPIAKLSLQLENGKIIVSK